MAASNNSNWLNGPPLALPGRSRADTFGDYDVDNFPRFASNCPCCMQNAEHIKFQMILTKIPISTGRQPWELFKICSRAETLPCADCEGIKQKLNTFMNWETSKDAMNFITVHIPLAEGIFLLKDTRVFRTMVPNFRYEL